MAASVRPTAPYSSSVASPISVSLHQWPHGDERIAKFGCRPSSHDKDSAAGNKLVNRS
jgi:hypothetical protein